VREGGKEAWRHGERIEREGAGRREDRERKGEGERIVRERENRERTEISVETV
jgi:hypothetical protein